MERAFASSPSDSTKASAQTAGHASLAARFPMRSRKAEGMRFQPEKNERPKNMLKFVR